MSSLFYFFKNCRSSYLLPTNKTLVTEVIVNCRDDNQRKGRTRGSKKRRKKIQSKVRKMQNLEKGRVIRKKEELESKMKKEDIYTKEKKEERKKPIFIILYLNFTSD